MTIKQQMTMTVSKQIYFGANESSIIFLSHNFDSFFPKYDFSISYTRSDPLVVEGNENRVSLHQGRA